MEIDNFSFTVSNNAESKNSCLSTRIEQFDFSSNNKPSDIFSLAKAFLSISEMTNKKLQKLCYYAKGWYLAIYDTNIISEQFQAWVHGAVQPALYQKYKVYGFSDIPKFTNVSELPEEFVSFAKEIYASYGHLSGDQLEIINHKETPWLNARKNCEPWENSSNEISEEDMKLFFREKLKNG